jgi:hypothetical protein
MTLPGLDLEKDNFIRKCDGNSTVNPFEDFSVGM